MAVISRVTTRGFTLPPPSRHSISGNARDGFSSRTPTPSNGFIPIVAMHVGDVSVLRIRKRKLLNRDQVDGDVRPQVRGEARSEAARESVMDRSQARICSLGMRSERRKSYARAWLLAEARSCLRLK